jgi:hypothetical protein
MRHEVLLNAQLLENALAAYWESFEAMTAESVPSH